MHSFLGRSFARAHRVAVCMILLLAFVGACSSSDVNGPGNAVAGSYVATTFVVTPTGQSPIDVLQAGGSLHITIAADSTTTGSLDIPASVTGSSDFVADMAGTASVTTSTVSFDQAADTFVRDLTWGRTANTLTGTNQAAGSASFTIALTRQ